MTAAQYRGRVLDHFLMLAGVLIQDIDGAGDREFALTAEARESVVEALRAIHSEIAWSAVERSASARQRERETARRFRAPRAHGKREGRRY